MVRPAGYGVACWHEDSSVPRPDLSVLLLQSRGARPGPLCAKVSAGGSTDVNATWVNVSQVGLGVDGKSIYIQSGLRSVKQVRYFYDNSNNKEDAQAIVHSGFVNH